MTRAQLIKQMKDKCDAQFRGTVHHFELRREIDDYERNGLQCISIDELIEQELRRNKVDQECYMIELKDNPDQVCMGRINGSPTIVKFTDKYALKYTNKDMAEKTRIRLDNQGFTGYHVTDHLFTDGIKAEGTFKSQADVDEGKLTLNVEIGSPQYIGLDPKNRAEVPYTDPPPEEVGPAILAQLNKNVMAVEGIKEHWAKAIVGALFGRKK